MGDEDTWGGLLPPPPHRGAAGFGGVFLAERPQLGSTRVCRARPREPQTPAWKTPLPEATQDAGRACPTGGSGPGGPWPGKGPGEATGSLRAQHGALPMSKDSDLTPSLGAVVTVRHLGFERLGQGHTGSELKRAQADSAPSPASSRAEAVGSPASPSPSATGAWPGTRRGAPCLWQQKQLTVQSVGR